MSNRGVMENKGLMFRASPEAVKGLIYAGIDVVNLANNHTGRLRARRPCSTHSTILRRTASATSAPAATASRPALPGSPRPRASRWPCSATTRSSRASSPPPHSRPGTAWIEPDNVVPRSSRPSPGRLRHCLVPLGHRVHARPQRQAAARWPAAPPKPAPG